MGERPILKYADRVDLYSVASSGTLHAAVGEEGLIVTSRKGDRTWTLSASGTEQALRSIIWSDSQFVAVGEGGIVTTSSDGIKWTSKAALKDTLLSIAWSGQKFAVVGTSFVVHTSPDGFTWTSSKTLDLSFNSILWTGNEFLALGNYHGGSNAILSRSTDGINWNEKEYINSSRFGWSSFADISLTWTGDQLIAVGRQNEIDIRPLTRVPLNVIPTRLANSLSMITSPTDLSITFPHELLGDKVSVNIFNVRGTKILNMSGLDSKRTLTVPVSKMGRGNYLLEVQGSKSKLSKAFYLAANSTY